MGQYTATDNNKIQQYEPQPITRQGDNKGSLQEAVNSSTSNIDYGTQTYPKPFIGINLQETAGLQFAKKIMGSTIQITSELEQINNILKELDTNNNFLNIGYEINKYNSVYGYCIVLINIVKNKVYWSVARPFQTNYTKFYNELTQVDLYSLITSGSKGTTILHKKLDNKQIITNYQSTTKDLEQQYELKDSVINHNLGWIPASLFTNYPIKSPWNLGFRDAYPDGNNFKGAQITMNQLWNLRYYEGNANKTRIFIKLTSKEYEQIDSFDNGKILDKYYNAGILILPNGYSDGYGNGVLQSWVEVQSGNPNLELYQKSIEDLANFYYESIGLSTKTENAGITTATEINYNAGADTETVILKRNLFKDQILDLIIKSVLIYTQDYTYQEIKDVINITLKENLGITRDQQIQESVYLIDNGLSTPILELMKINNETKENSELLYREIQSYQNEAKNTLYEDDTEPNDEVLDNV